MCSHFYQVTFGIIACVDVTTTTTGTTPQDTTTTGAPISTTISPTLSTGVQCVYSEWTNWTSCTVTCGEGTQTHARNIIAGFCTEPLVETRICKMEPCPCIFTQDIYVSTFQKYPGPDSKF